MNDRIRTIGSGPERGDHIADCVCFMIAALRPSLAVPLQDREALLPKLRPVLLQAGEDRKIASRDLGGAILG
jgi:hypothetical protein